MILVVQNDPKCPAGSCTGLIESVGESFLVAAAYDAIPLPDPATFSAVIVLGGEMGVHQTDRFPYLINVALLMRLCVDRAVPLLGICLGGQLLAQLLGGTVSSPSPHGERGIGAVTLTPAGVADPLFREVPPTFTTFQLHNDSFSVPPGATLLASSRACPAQAFRQANAYGLQFHPEVDRDIVSCWSALPPAEPDLARQFDASREPFDRASHRILLNFLSLAASLPVS